MGKFIVFIKALTLRLFAFNAFLLSILLPLADAHGEEYPLYELNVSFEIEKNLLSGVAKIIFPDDMEVMVNTGGLMVSSIIMNGKDIKNNEDEFYARGTLEISYECICKEVQEDLNNVGLVSGNIISRDGIYLTGMWYPSLDCLSVYRLKAVVPEVFQAVSEADEITVLKKNSGMEHTFIFPHPLDRVTLVAARYEIEKESMDGIEISAWFFHEDKHLAKTYIEHSKKYIKLYSELFGAYPYRRFSVVENLFPTGYSMPTFTLMGRTVVRLPFIVATSLGHEVLHQWFGNCLFVDYDKGNWAEGLTTYLSDHFFDEQKGEGWKHRKKLLLDYRNYVNEGNEISLDEFAVRKDPATKAVGYGKAVMVFHMLKKLAGDEEFFSSINLLIQKWKFQAVSWDEIREAFEEITHMQLEWFFDQWLTEKGMPDIAVEDARALMVKGVPTVAFRLIQKGTPYRLRLPVKVVTDRGEFARALNFEGKTEFYEIPVDGTPHELIIDDDYDIMRMLSDTESPPVISGLLGDTNRLVVVPERVRAEYENIIEDFKSMGFKIANEAEITDKEIKASSLLVFGSDGPLPNRLFGKRHESSILPASLTVEKNPLNTSKVVAIVRGSPDQLSDILAKKILHYGKYSFISFNNKSVDCKKTAASARGIRCSLYSPVMGIRPESAACLDEIIRDITDVPLIYVGEGHTFYEDHKVQLQVIKRLYESGRKIAIGMEMFQISGQGSLDDYLSGETTEAEFLKTSEYYKRWKFDYHLYREIIEFAKEKAIPVVALNQIQEIIKKVSRGGLDALNGEERKNIPEDMDMSDGEYKKRLTMAFRQHSGSMSINLDNFYQAQILWDETMAHSVDRFLMENPDYQMVIIAGSGHIAYGSGIPRRVYRLNGKKYVTLLNVKAGTPITGLADYVLFPEPASPPASPVLGIIIEKENEQVIIRKLVKGGLAEKAGLKEGDNLDCIDDAEIGDLDDVYIALLNKKKGDTVYITILRKRFLLRDKKMKFRILIP